MGKVDGDTIDLHGQFVEEAEEILEQRIRYAQSTGQTHLHVIVGKGNHSPDHIQKIAPRVEQICRELRLQYHTEENEGRIYVNLQGGKAESHITPKQHHQPQHENYGKPHYETAYPMGKNPKYGGSYAQAAGGMQYQQKPQQQMDVQEPQGQQKDKESKCCGLCVVM